MYEIPSEGKLEKLYIPALIGYAARSALRVLPLYQKAKGLKDHQKYFQFLETAVALLINKSTTAGLTEKEQEAVEYATKHANGYVRQSESSEKFNGNYENVTNLKTAEYAASAAYWAACTADISSLKSSVPDHLVDCPDMSLDEYYYQCALYSNGVFANFAYKTAEFAYKADTNSAAGANNDYQTLLSMNLLNNDTIDLTENGPLGPYWPEGLEPNWYKELYPKMRALLDEPLEE